MFRDKLQMRNATILMAAYAVCTILTFLPERSAYSQMQTILMVLLILSAIVIVWWQRSRSSDFPKALILLSALFFTAFAVSSYFRFKYPQIIEFRTVETATPLIGTSITLAPGTVVALVHRAGDAPSGVAESVEYAILQSPNGLWLLDTPNAGWVSMAKTRWTLSPYF